MSEETVPASTPVPDPAPADEPRRGLIARLRARYGVGPWGLLAILAAFALAGMSVLKISRPIMHWLLPPDTPKWLWWTVRICVIVPIYEVLLFCYGTILGKREFFWSKQKRSLLFITRPFRLLARSLQRS